MSNELDGWEEWIERLTTGSDQDIISLKDYEAYIATDRKAEMTLD